MKYDTISLTLRLSKDIIEICLSMAHFGTFWLLSKKIVQWNFIFCHFGYFFPLFDYFDASFRVGGNQCATRIVVAYQACNTQKRAFSATIAQQLRYWLRQGDKRSPQKNFHQQLLAALREWRQDGDKIILLMDSNEDMAYESLA